MEDSDKDRVFSQVVAAGLTDLLCDGKSAAIRTVGCHRECHSAPKVLKQQIPENGAGDFIKAAK